MISLIVPFYNERSKIQRTYKTLRSILIEQDESFELIFVNDGSSDDSLKRIQSVTQNDNNTQILSYKTNRGRGFALKYGFEKARGDKIGYIDSDLEINPSYIPICLDKLKDSDVVIVSKHLKGSWVDSPRFRKLSSLLFNLLINLVLHTHISDHQAGLKFFKKSVLKSILPKTSHPGWLFDVELCYFAKKQKRNIEEVPVEIKYGYDDFNKSMISDFLGLVKFILLLSQKG